jgi:hypothetical protein
MIVNFVVGFVVAAGTDVVVINIHHGVIVLSVNVRTQQLSGQASEREKKMWRKKKKIGRPMTSFLYAPK